MAEKGVGTYDPLERSTKVKLLAHPFWLSVCELWEKLTQPIIFLYFCVFKYLSGDNLAKKKL